MSNNSNNQCKASIDSEFYPYIKPYPGFYTLKHTRTLLSKVLDYILDMPDPTTGYVPKDDNSFCRTELWKYLYYDDERPDLMPLPTPAQKKSVLFNPEFPTDPPDKQKGYRLIPQEFIKPAQTEAQVRLYVHQGRTIATSDNEAQLSVVFDVFVHYTEQSNTKVTSAKSRAATITQCLMEAFHGINMLGIGGFYFNRSKHADCTDSPFTDGKENVGRRLVLGVSVGSDTANYPVPNNMAPLDNGFWLA